MDIRVIVWRRERWRHLALRTVYVVLQVFHYTALEKGTMYYLYFAGCFTALHFSVVRLPMYLAECMETFSDGGGIHKVAGADLGK